MFYNFNPMFDFRSVQNNPKFKEFCDQNKGKTAEQICKENGIDYNMFKNLLSLFPAGINK